MADPLTVLGAAASITTLIEVLSKTVIALHTLHTRYSSADFTFLNLISQLTALKAALTRLQEWMDTDIDEVHHQLVMDLEVSVTCCRMLVKRIGDEVELLGGDGNGGNGEGIGVLDTKGKIRLIVKGGGLEELQKMVDRQTGALGLLLTVCNCKAISDQKLLLEKTVTRKTFTRIKDDTSSLYVQRDSTPLYSRCTDNLSNFSKRFEFDSELLISKVYEKAIRVSMRATLGKGLWEKKQKSYFIATKTEVDSDDLTEYSFQEYSETLRNTRGIILLEDSDSELVPMKAVRFLYPESFSPEEREHYRLLAMKNVLNIVRGINKAMDNSILVMGDPINTPIRFFLQDIGCVQVGEKVTIESAHLVHSLWEDGIQPIEDLSSSTLSSSTRSRKMIPEIESLTQEHKLQIGSFHLHIVHAAILSSMNNWSSFFEATRSTSSMIFFVDHNQRQG